MPPTNMISDDQRIVCKLEDFLRFFILGFSKILRFLQRFFFIFDEVYEDFQSNLPLGVGLDETPCLMVYVRDMN